LAWEEFAGYADLADAGNVENFDITDVGIAAAQ